eukprot:TRINITY_DN20837_c0_g1_i1.p1 TRINITY_DN20837_c0_g1~~TRINITY_DN20837_c0_g1_i1.p1  ORF type:complete len:268 (+),score=22.68 TRINITY_DN20837_c0_g1_i1:371-1174(+)
MGRPLVFDVIQKPVTSILISICTGLWVYIQNKGVGYGDVGVSYENIVVEKQYWRVITACFSHISFLHLVFNMSSLWSLGVVEKLPDLGSVYYLKHTLVLVIASEVLCVAIYHVLIHRYRIEHYKRVIAVGYSGVVFGWMTVLSQKMPTSTLDVFGVLSLPINLAPFESLIFTSILVPQASFIGHLSGIIVGYSIAFGLWRGLTDYWAVNLSIWVALTCIVTLKRSGAVDMPYFQIENLVAEATSPTVLVQGRDTSPLLVVPPGDHQV